MCWTAGSWTGFFPATHMSDDTAPTPDPSSIPANEAAPRSRRISTPRPKKNAKAQDEPSDLPAPEEPVSAVPVAMIEAEDDSRSSANENDWPEPEAATDGQPAMTESAKRKRRRRKGKGKGDGSQNAAPQHSENLPAPESASTDESANPEAGSAPHPPATPKPHPQQQQQHPQQQSPRPKIDPELLTKMAWKIYLAEVSEEGVALIGDNDAKDLSRRCFRLAEIFVEEQMRRR